MVMVFISNPIPPINAYIYIQWLESNEEQPGWYRAKVIKNILVVAPVQYFTMTHLNP